MVRRQDTKRTQKTKETASQDIGRIMIEEIPMRDRSPRRTSLHKEDQTRTRKHKVTDNIEISYTDKKNNAKTQMIDEVDGSFEVLLFVVNDLI